MHWALPDISMMRDGMAESEGIAPCGSGSATNNVDRPLHGQVILLKEMIGTADKMSSSSMYRPTP